MSSKARIKPLSGKIQERAGMDNSSKAVRLKQVESLSLSVKQNIDSAKTVKATMFVTSGREGETICS
jgi:hypothetical protein